jgi:hypothetical protein
MFNGNETFGEPDDYIPNINGVNQEIKNLVKQVE